MISDKRVVVTGMGIVSSLGCTVDLYWSALRSGESGIKLIVDDELAKFPTKIAAWIEDYEIPEILKKRKEVRHWDKSILYGVDATLQAVEHSGLNLNEVESSRLGVYIGTGIGGIETLCTASDRLYAKEKLRTSPYLIPMMIPNMASGVVAMEIGAQGPSAAIVSACATANSAIGEAMFAILNDRADVMIAGGAEAPITALAMAGFCSMKAMSTRNDNPQAASAPFDALRDGFVMGEGAGILILEDLRYAQQRGAQILAEITGYGTSTDAYHLTAPDPEGKGAFAAMRQAVNMSEWEIEQIDYINAHGTGTPLGDKAETQAITRLSGTKNKVPLISSTKSATGHLFGAAGGIEAIAVIQAIQNNVIPPTLNLENPDPECDLDYVAMTSRNHVVNRALSNGFGFGGHNSVLAVSSYEE